MSQEYIEIRGARENNLKNVSLRIPKRKITIFTGVSGSGKSSIVFDTVATEAQRQMNENFSMFIRTFLPRYSQPDADAIENLSMPIVVDQKRLGGGSHSTMGTITDIYPVLRRLYSHIGKPYVGHANVFSFNDPKGMCPNCNGLGRKMGVDLDLFLDKSKTLNEGAILFHEYAIDTWGWNILGQSKLFDMDKKLSKFSEKEMELLLYSKPYKVKTTVGGKAFNLTCEGIINRFIGKYITRDVKTMSERTQKAVAPYITMAPCTVCKGARLSQEVLKSQDRRIQHRRVGLDGSGPVDQCNQDDQGTESHTHFENTDPAPAISGGYRPRISHVKSRNRHALRWRIAACEDRQTPEQQPRGRDVYVRRAQRRPSPARCASFE